MTWRDNILKSLVNLGFTRNVAHYINNFLQERNFIVRINNTVSSVTRLQNEIPQGSVISDTPFLLNINNIFQKLSLSIKTHLFADDLVILTRGKDLGSMRNLMQSSLQDLQECSATTGLKFSTTKSKCMLFTKRQVQEKPTLKLGNDNLEH